jgi:hypothetical protein
LESNAQENEKGSTMFETLKENLSAIEEGVLVIDCDGNCNVETEDTFASKWREQINYLIPSANLHGNASYLKDIKNKIISKCKDANEHVDYIERNTVDHVDGASECIFATYFN